MYILNFEASFLVWSRLLRLLFGVFFTYCRQLITFIRPYIRHCFCKLFERHLSQSALTYYNCLQKFRFRLKDQWKSFDLQTITAGHCCHTCFKVSLTFQINMTCFPSINLAFFIHIDSKPNLSTKLNIFCEAHIFEHYKFLSSERYMATLHDLDYFGRSWF